MPSPQANWSIGHDRLPVIHSTQQQPLLPGGTILGRILKLASKNQQKN
jgi:hypothetical protein